VRTTLWRKQGVRQVKEYNHDRRANAAHETHLLAETQFSDSVGLGETY
jgi:hypothetical protein